MFFFSFEPWAIFLSAGIFEFRPKNFFDFSNLYEDPGGKRAQVTVVSCGPFAIPYHARSP